MDKKREDFWYLKKKFHQLSDAKNIEGIFVGPLIQTIFKEYGQRKVE